jgi:hypothetical protein
MSISALKNAWPALRMGLSEMQEMSIPLAFIHATADRVCLSKLDETRTMRWRLLNEFVAPFAFRNSSIFRRVFRSPVWP